MIFLQIYSKDGVKRLSLSPSLGQVELFLWTRCSNEPQQQAKTRHRSSNSAT